MSLRKFIISDTPYAVGHNMPTDRILYLCNLTPDGCVYADAILKSPVAGCIKGTIFQRDAVKIAERLLTADMTADKSYVATMPRKIFAIKHGIVNRHVITLPKTILGGDTGIVNFDMFAILENILRIANKTIDVNIRTKHEWISAAFQLHLPQSQTVNTPESLIGIGESHTFQCKITHLSKKLRSIDDTIAHRHIIRIPNSASTLWRKVTSGDKTAINMPPRIFTIETRIVTFQIAATFDS